MVFPSLEIKKAAYGCKQLNHLFIFIVYPKRPVT